jgi:hypothetical protein
MSAFNADIALAEVDDAAREIIAKGSKGVNDSGDVLERIGPEETIELEQRRIEAREADAAALEEAQEVYADVVCDIVAGYEIDPDDLVDVVEAAHKTPAQFSADMETINAEMRLSSISEIKNRAKYAAAVRDRGPKHDRRSPILDLFKTALTGVCD